MYSEFRIRDFMLNHKKETLLAIFSSILFVNKVFEIFY